MKLNVSDADLYLLVAQDLRNNGQQDTHTEILRRVYERLQERFAEAYVPDEWVDA